MFKSVDHHNPTLELTMVKRKMWGLLSYSLRKHNSHSIQSNPQDSDVSCDWQDVADSRFISKCRYHYWNPHNFTACRPFSQPFLLGLWQAVHYLNSKFASIAKIWKLLATKSRNKITKSRGQLQIKQQWKPLSYWKRQEREDGWRSHMSRDTVGSNVDKKFEVSIHGCFIRYFFSA